MASYDDQKKRKPGDSLTATPVSPKPAAPPIVRARVDPTQQHTFGDVNRGLAVESTPRPSATAAPAPRAANPAQVQAGPPRTAMAQPGDRNTFTGSNNITRTVNTDGSISGRGSNPGGSFQVAGGAPVTDGRGGVAFATSAQPGAAPAAAGAPMGDWQKNQAVMAATPGTAAYQQAQAAFTRGNAPNRNLATNAAASQVSARDFGAPDLAELRRRFATEMSGPMTASARRALGGQQQDILRSIMGSEQIGQQGAEGAIAANNRSQQDLDLESARGGNALAERGLSNQGNLDANAQQAALEANAPQQFVDEQGNASIRRGNALTPITGPDGKPARVALTEQSGQITPEVAFKAMNEELASLNDPLMGVMTPEDRAQREADIQARFAPYLGQQQGAQPSAPAGAPAAGTIKNGYRFKGGNPNDKANWEKAQ